MSDEEIKDMSVQVCLECNDAEKDELKKENEKLNEHNNILSILVFFFAAVCFIMAIAIGF